MHLQQIGELEERHPVGGRLFLFPAVFDVTGAEGVQTIAIDAALVVDQPGLFVITREVRGGVVVSRSDHLAYAKTP